MANEFSELDFFRGSELIDDPYPYYEALRAAMPRHPGRAITGSP